MEIAKSIHFIKNKEIEKAIESFKGFERQAIAYSVQYLFFPLVFFRHMWRLSRGHTLNPKPCGYTLEGSFRKAEYQYLAAGLLTKVSMFLLLLSTLRELYEEARSHGHKHASDRKSVV